MSCLEIQSQLSAYMDGVLDPKERGFVDIHLKGCSGCREELRDLKALSQELWDLEKMKTPADFLDQVHERIEKTSPLNRLLKKLFRPLHLKVPLEAAALAATAVLVFSIWQAQRVDVGMVQAPMQAEETVDFGKRKSDPEKVSARRQPLKSAPRPEIQKEERVPFETETMDVAEKETPQVPIELVLMTRSPERSLSGAPAPGMEKKDTLSGLMDQAPGPENRVPKMARSSPMKKSVKASKEKMKPPLGPLIQAMGGVVTSWPHDDADTLEARIPASKYEALVKALKAMGSLKAPPLIQPREEGEHLIIRIRLIN